MPKPGEPAAVAATEVTQLTADDFLKIITRFNEYRESFPKGQRESMKDFIRLFNYQKNMGGEFDKKDMEKFYGILCQGIELGIVPPEGEELDYTAIAKRIKHEILKDEELSDPKKPDASAKPPVLDAERPKKEISISEETLGKLTDIVGKISKLDKDRQLSRKVGSLLEKRRLPYRLVEMQNYFAVMLKEDEKDKNSGRIIANLEALRIYAREVLEGNICQEEERESYREAIAAIEKIFTEVNQEYEPYQEAGHEQAAAAAPSTGAKHEGNADFILTTINLWSLAQFLESTQGENEGFKRRVQEAAQKRPPLKDIVRCMLELPGLRRGDIALEGEAAKQPEIAAMLKALLDYLDDAKQAGVDIQDKFDSAQEKILRNWVSLTSPQITPPPQQPALMPEPPTGSGAAGESIGISINRLVQIIEEIQEHDTQEAQKAASAYPEQMKQAQNLTNINLPEIKKYFSQLGTDVVEPGNCSQETARMLDFLLIYAKCSETGGFYILASKKEEIKLRGIIQAAKQRRPESPTPIGSRTNIMQQQTLGNGLVEEVLKRAEIPQKHQKNYIDFVSKLLLANVDPNKIIQFIKSVEGARWLLSNKWIREARHNRTEYERIAREKYPEFFREQLSQANFHKFLIKDIIEICQQFNSLPFSDVTELTEFGSSIFPKFNGDEDALLKYLLDSVNLERACRRELSKIANKLASSERYKGFRTSPNIKQGKFYDIISQRFFPRFFDIIQQKAPNEVKVNDADLLHLFSECEDMEITEQAFSEAGPSRGIPIISPEQSSEEKLLEAKIRVLIKDSYNREQLLKLLQEKKVINVTTSKLRQIEKKRIEISEEIDRRGRMGKEGYKGNEGVYLKRLLFDRLCRHIISEGEIDGINAEQFVEQELNRVKDDLHFNIDLLCYRHQGGWRDISDSNIGNYHEILGEIRDISKLEGYITKIEQIRQRCINRISKECSKIAQRHIPESNMIDEGRYMLYALQRFYPRFVELLKQKVGAGNEINQRDIENELAQYISELTANAQRLSKDDYDGIDTTQAAEYNRSTFNMPSAKVRAVSLLAASEDTEVLMSTEEKNRFAEELYNACLTTAGEAINSEQAEGDFKQKFNKIKERYLTTCDMENFITESCQLTVAAVITLKGTSSKRECEGNFERNLESVKKRLGIGSTYTPPGTSPNPSRRLTTATVVGRLVGVPLPAVDQQTPQPAVPQQPAVPPQPAPPSADSPIIEVVTMPQRAQGSALPQGEANIQKLKQGQIKDKLHFHNRLVATIALGVATVGCVIGAGVLIAVTGGIAAAPLIPLVALVCSAGAGLLATIRAGMNTARTRSTISHNQESLEEAQPREAKRMKQTPQPGDQIQQTPQPTARPNPQPVNFSSLEAAPPKPKDLDRT